MGHLGQSKMASEIANCVLGGYDLPLVENQQLLSCLQILSDHTISLPTISLYYIFFFHTLLEAYHFSSTKFLRIPGVTML